MTSGWSVDALLVFVDDQLVYQLVGGQPTISERDLQDVRACRRGPSERRIRRIWLKAASDHCHPLSKIKRTVA